MQNIRVFLSEIFSFFLEVKFLYLNRRVFVMVICNSLIPLSIHSTGIFEETKRHFKQFRS